MSVVDLFSGAGGWQEGADVTIWEGLNPPYRTIVADPPWDVVRRMGAGGRRARETPKPYSTLTTDEIGRLPVGLLASDSCALFLWVTSRLNREGTGCHVARSWGFEPVGEFIWEKPNFGMGVFPRIGHEVLLVCTRGTGALSDVRRDVHSVQRWPQGYTTNGGKTHSAKPRGALDLIEECSRGPYVELFARQPRLGWDAWGYGYESDAS